jgi:transglutaminase-like putative cysteine protease
VVEGLMSGWARMLTVALPADVVGDLLVTPLALAFLAALAGTLLALRTSWVTILALPPLLLYVTGLLATASRPAPRLLLTGAFLLALLFLVLVRSNRVTAAAREGISERDAEAVGLDLAAQRWHSTLGRVAFGLPMVAAMTALGLVGAWTLPVADGSDRFDPRELRQQNFRLAASLTPLVRVKPQLETSPPVKLFTVKVAQRGGTYSLDRIRVAALDSFDGALWTQSRDFVIAGSTLPEGPRLAPPVITLDLDVDVTRLPDPFLPVVGRAVRVTAEDVAFDPQNGTLVSTRPAVAGYRYHVTSQVRPADDSLSQARGSAEPEDRAYTLLPNPPVWVYPLARDITRPGATPILQLLEIEKFLKGFGYSTAARPGHSYGAVDRILRGQANAEPGHAEQFASAFAILARAAGYPTRVAVGYRLQPDKRSGDIYRVDTADAHAWPEVHLAGFGWVPFEPTNTKNPATAAPPREKTAPVLPTDQTRQQPRQPEPAAVEGATPVPGQGFAGTVRRAAIVVALLLLALLVLLLAAIPVKALRRYRRARRGPPSIRIAAAWRETTDRLRERGVAAPPARTPIEVAEAAAAGPGSRAADQVTELALIATTAVCAPYEPPDEAARRSWELEAEIRRILDRGTPLPRRIRALLDPRPLLPRRRPALVRRPIGTRKTRPSRQRRREPVGTGGRP